MGFGGGGGAQLTNHVHDNTPLQGGPLNFKNTTIGGMNSGDLTYSDGAALQQLAIAAPNDELRVSAGNIPEWYTPAAAASVWTKVYDSGQIGVAGDIDSGVFAAYDFLMIFWSGAINTTGWGASLKFNNTASGSGLYNWTDTRTNSAQTIFSSSTASAIGWDYSSVVGGSTAWQQCTMTVTNYPTNRKTATWNAVSTSAGAIPDRNFGAAMYENSLTQITRVEMCDDVGTTGVARQFAAGSQLIILGLT